MTKQTPQAATNLRVAIVAPIWQQNVVSLWLQAVGKIACVTGTTTFAALDASLIHDLVILALPGIATDEAMAAPVGAQIQTIQQRWPAARICVLVDDPTTQAQVCQAEPDITVLVGTIPQQLLAFLGSIAMLGVAREIE